MASIDDHGSSNMLLGLKLHGDNLAAAGLLQLIAEDIEEFEDIVSLTAIQ